MGDRASVRQDTSRITAELIEWAQSANEAALADAVSLIARLGDPSAAPAIARLTRHRDGEVRLVVAQALAAIGDGSAATVAALIELSNDMAEEVRSWATYALGAESLASTSGVREALQARLDDDSDDVRSEALRAMTRWAAQNGSPWAAGDRPGLDG